MATANVRRKFAITTLDNVKHLFSFSALGIIFYYQTITLKNQRIIKGNV